LSLWKEVDCSQYVKRASMLVSVHEDYDELLSRLGHILILT